MKGAREGSGFLHVAVLQMGWEKGYSVMRICDLLPTFIFSLSPLSLSRYSTDPTRISFPYFLLKGPSEGA